MKKKDGLELVDLLRRAIISGEYKPRERLVENELAQKYAVSRTPVREALKHLEALGLVKMERYKGAMVADINPREIKGMHIVRAGLEGMATGLACEHMTPEDVAALRQYEQDMDRAVEKDDIQAFSEANELFHLLIFEKNGNQFLRDMILNLLKRSWYEPSTSWKGLGDVPLIMEGHRHMLKVLENHDVQAARDAAEKHIMDAIAVNEAQGRYYEVGMSAFKEA